MIHIDSFLLPNSYELHCTWREKSFNRQGTCRNINFMFGTSMLSTLQARKAWALHRVTQSKEIEPKEKKGDIDMKIREVTVTDREDAMSVENVTAVHVRIFNINYYYQADLFLKIEHIEDLYILLRDVSLSHVTSLRSSFHA